MIVDPNAPALPASGPQKRYGKGAAPVRAVDGVSLEIAQGESVAMPGPELGPCGNAPRHAARPASVPSARPRPTGRRWTPTKTGC